MKKYIKIILAVACVAVMGVALAACNFGYPKVAGCTYKFDKLEYNNEGLTASEILSLESQLAKYRASETGLTMSFSSEDKTVEYTSLLGIKSTYNYKQDGANVVVYDAPNKNTTYNGDNVTGFTITKESNEVLTWHIAMILTDGDKQVDINMYYNLVTPETPAE
ncbi:MAG: hypothetical protein K2J83_06800 [Clostridia bacterium]|nr:hypothetical protein [Clostridia bacterium]